jgi:hypothetical protein
MAEKIVIAEIDVDVEALLKNTSDLKNFERNKGKSLVSNDEETVNINVLTNL